MIKKIVPELISAALALCGYFLIGYGCWIIWHPLAYIFAGGLLCIMATGTLNRAEVPE